MAHSKPAFVDAEMRSEMRFYQERRNLPCSPGLAPQLEAHIEPGSQKPNAFNDLPVELLALVLYNNTPAEISNVMHTSRRLYATLSLKENRKQLIGPIRARELARQQAYLEALDFGDVDLVTAVIRFRYFFGLTYWRQSVTPDWIYCFAEIYAAQEVPPNATGTRVLRDVSSINHAVRALFWAHRNIEIFNLCQDAPDQAWRAAWEGRRDYEAVTHGSLAEFGPLPNETPSSMTFAAIIRVRIILFTTIWDPGELDALATRLEAGEIFGPGCYRYKTCPAVNRQALPTGNHRSRARAPSRVDDFFMDSGLLSPATLPRVLRHHVAYYIPHTSPNARLRKLIEDQRRFPPYSSIAIMQASTLCVPTECNASLAKRQHSFERELWEKDSEMCRKLLNLPAGMEIPSDHWRW